MFEMLSTTTTIRFIDHAGESREFSAVYRTENSGEVTSADEFIDVAMAVASRTAREICAHEQREDPADA